MKSHIAIATTVVAALAIGVHAQEQVDEAIVARIKMEAFQHSRVMETLAWSPAINGRVSGTPVLVDVSTPADFDKYRGKLRGAIVLNGRPSAIPATTFTPSATRYTDEELARGTAAIDPT